MSSEGSKRGIYSQHLIRDVGLVLAVCVQDVIQFLPEDPIDYMAHWLYKYKENTLYFENKESLEKNVRQVSHLEKDKRAQSKRRIKDIKDKIRKLRVLRRKILLNKGIFHSLLAVGCSDISLEGTVWSSPGLSRTTSGDSLVSKTLLQIREQNDQSKESGQREQDAVSEQSGRSKESGQSGRSKGSGQSGRSKKSGQSKKSRLNEPLDHVTATSFETYQDNEVDTSSTNSDKSSVEFLSREARDRALSDSFWRSLCRQPSQARDITGWEVNLDEERPTRPTGIHYHTIPNSSLEIKDDHVGRKRFVLALKQPMQSRLSLAPSVEKNSFDSKATVALKDVVSLEKVTESGEVAGKKDTLNQYQPSTSFGISIDYDNLLKSSSDDESEFDSERETDSETEPSITTAPYKNKRQQFDRTDTENHESKRKAYGLGMSESPMTDQSDESYDDLDSKQKAKIIDRGYTRHTHCAETFQLEQVCSRFFEHEAGEEEDEDGGKKGDLEKSKRESELIRQRKSDLVKRKTIKIKSARVPSIGSSVSVSHRSETLFEDNDVLRSDDSERNVGDDDLEKNKERKRFKKIETYDDEHKPDTKMTKQSRYENIENEEDHMRIYSKGSETSRGKMKKKSDTNKAIKQQVSTFESDKSDEEETDSENEPVDTRDNAEVMHEKATLGRKRLKSHAFKKGKEKEDRAEDYMDEDIQDEARYQKVDSRKRHKSRDSQSKYDADIDDETRTDRKKILPSKRLKKKRESTSGDVKGQLQSFTSSKERDNTHGGGRFEDSEVNEMNDRHHRVKKRENGNERATSKGTRDDEIGRSAAESERTSPTYSTDEVNEDDERKTVYRDKKEQKGYEHTVRRSEKYGKRRSREPSREVLKGSLPEDYVKTGSSDSREYQVQAGKIEVHAEDLTRKIEVHAEDQTRKIEVHAEDQTRKIEVHAEDQTRKIEVDAEDQTKKIEVNAEDQTRKIEVHAEDQTTKIEVHAEDQTRKIEVHAEDQTRKIEVDAEDQTKKIEVNAEDQTRKIEVDAEDQTRKIEVDAEDQTKKIEVHIEGQTEDSIAAIEQGRKDELTEVTAESPTPTTDSAIFSPSILSPSRSLKKRKPMNRADSKVRQTRSRTIEATSRPAHWYLVKEENVIVCDHPVLGILRSRQRPLPTTSTTDHILDRKDAPCEALYDSEIYVVCEPRVDDEENADRLKIWTEEAWVVPDPPTKQTRRKGKKDKS